MPNTYSQIYIQVVFAVKGRRSLIDKQYREELHKIISGIVKNRGQKPLAIFAMPDHLHLFMSLQPDIAISDLVRDIKAGSSKHINVNKWSSEKFNWKTGFGAFSYAKSQQETVVKYILNQEAHHKSKSFKKEYLEFLEKFEIDYDDQYLFDWIE